MTFKTLDDLTDIAGKRVLVRVDLNVPVKDGVVTDATRIERVAPTIRELSEKGAKVILLAHFGRPKGEPVAEMSLKTIAPAVEDILDQRVHFAADCIGDKAANAIAEMNDGDVLLLENTRFHKGEEKNEPSSSRRLPPMATSMSTMPSRPPTAPMPPPRALPITCPPMPAAPCRPKLEALEKGLGQPKRPVVAIVGGAKVSTKIDLLQNLVKKVDALVIGGGMANTFIAAKGINVGKSLCEHDLADTAKAIIAAAAEAGCAIVLPEDGVVAREFKAGADNEVVDVTAIPTDAMMLDVGPKSIAAVNDWISKAETLVWNGPLGAFEITPFDKATVAVAKHAAARTRQGSLVSVAGGGDTVAALNHAEVTDDFSYVSTAGGAFLEWMEGKPLPGVDILKQQN